MSRQHNRFTLIELLITIAIILILAGILIPTVNSAIKKAEQAKAKAEITTLVNAIKQYEATYGTLKFGTDIFDKVETGGTTDFYEIASGKYDEFIKMLQAEDDEYNKRKVKFLEIVANEAGEYKDPWGNDYVLKFGVNDKLLHLAGTNSNKIHGLADDIDTLRVSIAVMSKGPDGESSEDPREKVNADNVYSMTVVYKKGEGFQISN